MSVSDQGAVRVQRASDGLWRVELAFQVKSLFSAEGMALELTSRLAGADTPVRAGGHRRSVHDAGPLGHAAMFAISGSV